MESQLGTIYIEPVRYTVKRPAKMERGFAASEESLALRRRIRSETYFFDRVVRGNDHDFESIHVLREIRETVRHSAESLVLKLREKFQKIVPLTEMVDSLVPSGEKLSERILLEYEMPSEYFFSKRNSSVVLPINPNTFCILSRTKEEANQLVQYVRSEFEKLNEVTKDFGLELSEFITGRKYQEVMVRSGAHVQSIKLKEPTNDFEKEIISFCETVTSSFLPNLEITFDEPAETYEYDVFVCFTEEMKRIVEPTNYETIKDQLPSGENLKSQIVLKTLDKAQRLGAKSVVIAKGFPEEAFNQLKIISDSRGVTLLSDTNYKSSLFRILCTDLLRAYQEPVRRMYRYYEP